MRHHSAQAWSAALVILVLLVLYLGTIAIGLRVSDLSGLSTMQPPPVAKSWQAPLHSTIPRTPAGDSIRRGELIFNETALYAADHTISKIS